MKNEKLKCVASISTQPLESIPCRSAFGSDYSFDSSWVCLYQLFTSGFGDFPPFFLADLLKLCHVEQRGSVNKNVQVFSWATHVLSHSCSEVIPVLLWLSAWVSLSCWNINLHCSQRSSALWSRLSSRICLYLAPFIVPSILTSLQVPAAEKHPHSMMLPPPCFTVGMVLNGWWAVLGFHQT